MTDQPTEDASAKDASRHRRDGWVNQHGPLERLQARKTRTTLLALGGLLLVKEDMGLMVAGFGIAMPCG